ncbi:MAG: diphosphomevalonate/mevalonate 3,5-bisphosphate decarboxylase family protein [Bacteriovoracaceae bacterium]
MKAKDFMFQSTWSAPSNIAFVKYWGKKEIQKPMNPNISGTLSECRTQTQVKVLKSSNFLLNFSFEGRQNQSFAEKLKKILIKRIAPELKFDVDKFQFDIQSLNTFPHSCGIASSASFYASLALCLTEIENSLLGQKVSKEEFFNRASFLARLGSGSASRSLFSPFVSWGDTSEEFSHQIQIEHHAFQQVGDSIVVIDDSEKKVGSSVGHSLMDDHIYREKRLMNAKKNYDSVLEALQTGDWKEFINILEKEALELHALMMTSNPQFLLLRPDTIAVIEKLYSFRSKNNASIGFTLDAGPNIHLIYPLYEKELMLEFVEQCRLEFNISKVIYDEIGGEPKKHEVFGEIE